MNSIYEVILQFINAWFPNDLAIDLLALNELFAWVITLLIPIGVIAAIMRILGIKK